MESHKLNLLNTQVLALFLTSYYMLFSSFSDELSSILKKLSLEKYQPIFEEQEVFYLLCQRGSPKHFPSNIKSGFFFVSIRFESQVLNVKETALP